MKPNILLLDTIAAEGVDMLREFADLTDGRGYSAAQIEACIERFDALVVKSGNRIERPLIERATRLKVIGRGGSGLDNIDMAAARERGITVIASPEGNVESVAEHVLAMAIFLAHKLDHAHRGSRVNDYRRATWQGRNLASLNVGVIGAGHIGRAVIGKLQPLCRQVYALDPHVKDWRAFEDKGVIVMHDLMALLPLCDVLTLHLPLLDSTRHMLDAEAFGRMREGTILINTARGEIIDDAALLAAMERGTVAAAGLDALHPDPPFNRHPAETDYHHPLVSHPQVFYTPHIAAGTQDALREVATHLARKMAQHFAEHPVQDAAAR